MASFAVMVNLPDRVLSVTAESPGFKQLVRKIFFKLSLSTQQRMGTWLFSHLGKMKGREKEQWLYGHLLRESLYLYSGMA